MASSPWLRLVLRRLTTVAIYLVLVVIAVWVLIPIAILVTTSFKPAADIYQVPPTLLPSHWTISNYVNIYTGSDVPRSLLNSVLVGLLVAAISVVSGGCTGYGLARFRFAGSRVLALALLGGQLVPEAVLLLPLFEIFARARLVNTIPGVALAQVATVLPIVAWMSRSAFSAAPVELEEAAQVDGSTRLRAVIRVVLPIVAPALVAIAIYAFLQSWNEFMLASVFETGAGSTTGPVALTMFSGEFNTEWGSIMAAAVTLTVPVAVAFLLLQRFFVTGLSAGAVKG